MTRIENNYLYLSEEYKIPCVSFLRGWPSSFLPSCCCGNIATTPIKIVDKTIYVFTKNLSSWLREQGYRGHQFSQAFQDLLTLESIYIKTNFSIPDQAFFYYKTQADIYNIWGASQKALISISQAIDNTLTDGEKREECIRFRISTYKKLKKFAEAAKDLNSVIKDHEDLLPEYIECCIQGGCFEDAETQLSLLFLSEKRSSAYNLLHTLHEKNAASRASVHRKTLEHHYNKVIHELSKNSSPSIKVVLSENQNNLSKISSLDDESLATAFSSLMQKLENHTNPVQT